MDDEIYLLDTQFPTLDYLFIGRQNGFRSLLQQYTCFFLLILNVSVFFFVIFVVPHTYNQKNSLIKFK